jgi:hypothetical membrane protein
MKTHRALIGAVTLLMLVMFLLPIWSFEGYSLRANTTSHLGAQGTPHAWVMNITFVILGIATLGAAIGTLRRFPLALLLLAVFALSLVLTGVYRHEPLVVGIAVDEVAARRHSLFATTTGTAFVAFAATMVFVSRDRRDRILAGAMGVTSTALSLGMALMPDLTGLLQRVMFMMAFAWLVHVTGERYPFANETQSTSRP